MKKNTAILLSIGGVLLVGGVLLFIYRKPKAKDTTADEGTPEYTPPTELPKIDLGNIFKKSDKKKAQEDKYALMEKLKLSKSIIDATKKADEQNRFSNVKYPTINVGGLNIPTTNSNMDSINRLNPTKLSTTFKPSPYSGGIGSIK